ncbi:catechol 1,2-dioxygenase [Caballeronia choica]|uniref:Catechol 1,2-dioxygenase n=1 Tax=Caballeronia choica TaxID=326476 RepID=A0A158FVV5_9BURK|nr:catechol 1,2-dioxygenase [Caballeronia choica]
MRDINEDTITQAVIASMDDQCDSRLRTIIASLVQHLHSFACEVKLTEAEWFRAIQFLTETGHITDDKRQEFILLSDTLRLSMLVMAQNNKKPAHGRRRNTCVGGRIARIKSDSKSLSARSDCLYGAWMCGSVPGHVGMALHHKLCHTLGGSFNLPHAETHAIVLPHALAYNSAAAPGAMSRIARALGSESAALGVFELGRELDIPSGCPGRKGRGANARYA